MVFGFRYGPGLAQLGKSSIDLQGTNDALARRPFVQVEQGPVHQTREETYAPITQRHNHRLSCNKRAYPQVHKNAAVSIEGSELSTEPRARFLGQMCT